MYLGGRQETASILSQSERLMAYLNSELQCDSAADLALSCEFSMSALAALNPNASNTYVYGDNSSSLQFCDNSDASGENSNHLVDNSTTVRDNTTAFGHFAIAEENEPTALGTNSKALYENAAAIGGIDFYGDDVDVGATLAFRGNDNWAFGASVATAGEEATGKHQVRYEGF